MLSRVCSLALLVMQAAAQAAGDAQLHLLPPSRVAEFNARCLDGSAPGYYIRRSSTPHSTRFKFHIMGGGWCQSAADCYARSQSLLGSSTFWTPWLSALWPPEFAGFYGLMDANASANPFSDFTFVWLAYCDGSSQTSNRDEPVVYNGTSLYMRGRAILDAHLAELEEEEGFLSTATEVIVSGTSAGGLSTYLHASYIASRLAAPSVNVVAVPDAGFFYDHETYPPGSGEHAWLDSLTRATAPALWNATLSGPLAACLLSPPGGLRTRCFLPESSFAWQTVPFFIINSLYDPANLGISDGLSCNLYSSCDAQQVAAVRQYAGDLQASILRTIVPSRDSYFLTSCYQHEESCRARDWYGITIDGGTMNSTLYNFWLNGVGAASRRIDAPWPGDTSCAAQGGAPHGAC